MGEVNIIGISRHRILRDGKGITTLIGINGCPLRCEYCINKGLLRHEGPCHNMTTEDVLRAVEIDDLYFRSTNGGITFGGGEPLLNVDFIKEFRGICPSDWKINIETSLNVDRDTVDVGIDVVDCLIVDVKTLDSSIYKRYTSHDNSSVLSNLNHIAGVNMQDKIIIRLPMIPGYNDNADVERSKAILNDMGYTNVNIFGYVTNYTKRRTESMATKYGKGICNILKYVRKTVAEVNGILLDEEDCPMDVCRSGTCPKCEESLKYLSLELKKIPNAIY